MEPITIIGPAAGLLLVYLFFRWGLFPIRAALRDYEKQKRFAVFIVLTILVWVALSLLSGLRPPV